MDPRISSLWSTLVLGAAVSDAATIGRLIEAYEASLPQWGWPNWVIGSHDAARIAARVGEAQARVALMLLLTLRGTPTLYQGDELGIGEVVIPPERVRDPREIRQPGIGLGRDPSRTPMAWDASPNAGFSAAEPWLPLHADWRTRNVAAESEKPGSMLNLTRALLPGMIARGSGTILNICSTASITPYPNGGSYGIAKHALLGFSHTLREEMKRHGIRVVALLPGATLTDSWAGAGLPYSRFMPAEDVAESAYMAWRMSPRTVVEDILLRPMLGDIPSD